MSNPFKIELLSKTISCQLYTFRILYYKDRDLTLLPLMERKVYLSKAVGEETALNGLIQIHRGPGYGILHTCQTTGHGRHCRQKKRQFFI